jgi:hypothetical protein
VADTVLGFSTHINLNNPSEEDTIIIFSHFIDKETEAQFVSGGARIQPQFHLTQELKILTGCAV